MFWKKESHIEKKIDNLNSALLHSFTNVKKDTEYIFQWLNYFHKKTIEQEKIIKQLYAELNAIPKSKEQIKKLVDDYYSYESVISKIGEIEHKLTEISRRNEEQLKEASRQHHERISELSKRHDEKLSEIMARPIQHMPEHHALSELKSRLEKIEQRKPSLKEKLIKRITKNSKDYVKSMIIAYIKKYENISSLQLKEMVVEEQGLCSKSSFYRIMEEIEGSDEVGVIRRGKEKHYLSKILKKI